MKSGMKLITQTNANKEIYYLVRSKYSGKKAKEAELFRCRLWRRLDVETYKGRMFCGMGKRCEIIGKNLLWIQCMIRLPYEVEEGTEVILVGQSQNSKSITLARYR